MTPSVISDEATEWCLRWTVSETNSWSL